MIPAKRQRPVNQQNARTIELRALADDVESVEWEDDEITRADVEQPHPPPRQSMTSVHESVPAPAKAILPILAALPPNARIWALVAVLLFVGALLILGIKLPW